MARVDAQVPKHWIETIGGRRIDPLAPDEDQIDLADIAHALSNICRFTGHTREFYSVAQHSILVSRILPPELRLAGLLHDASEAYLSDVSSPVKHQPDFEAAYGPAEDRLMNVIATKFGFIWPPQNPVLKMADEAILRAEARDLMPTTTWWKEDATLIYAPKIVPLSPKVAKSAFLLEYRSLTTVTMSQPIAILTILRPYGRIILPEEAPA